MITYLIHFHIITWIFFSNRNYPKSYKLQTPKKPGFAPGGKEQGSCLWTQK